MVFVGSSPTFDTDPNPGKWYGSVGSGSAIETVSTVVWPEPDPSESSLKICILPVPGLKQESPTKQRGSVPQYRVPVPVLPKMTVFFTKLSCDSLQFSVWQEHGLNRLQTLNIKLFSCPKVWKWKEFWLVPRNCSLPGGLYFYFGGATSRHTQSFFTRVVIVKTKCTGIRISILKENIIYSKPWSPFVGFKKILSKDKFLQSCFIRDKHIQYTGNIRQKSKI